MINWESFRIYNQDAHGIQYKFEGLCRQLFINENLTGLAGKYLHANPNSPGLETEPIYAEMHKCQIGFQVKYFENNVDYGQIFESAEKIIKYYAGKVDIVYLFCNKPLNLSAKSYVATKELLQDSGIKLEPITDNAILDIVRKYSYLGLYYFGDHTLTFEWFSMHTTRMQNELGIRYNREFNIDTPTFQELSLFVQDQEAVKIINGKKLRLLETADGYYAQSDTERSYLYTLLNVVKCLSNVTTQTLQHSYNWKAQVETSVSTHLSQFFEDRNQLTSQAEQQRAIAYSEHSTKQQKDAAREELYRLNTRIEKLNSLIALPHILEVTERERNLLDGHVLSIFGDPGIGKTQLLAHKTQQLLDIGRVSLLLVAGIYFTNDPIQEQIMKNLKLDFSFDDLIDILEAIGERDNCIVPVFIDAINETWNKRLWKSGLAEIIEKINLSQMVRLVITYRPEYQKDLFSDAVAQMINCGKVVMLCHRGFIDNSIDAIHEFLNHYSIPFTPLEFLGYEMTNPLFLSLYCKTYNGEETSLPTLYERLVDNANSNIFQATRGELVKGISENDNIVKPLVYEIAKKMAAKGRRFLSQEEISSLSFWREYGIASASFMMLLEKEQIIHDSPFEDTTKYHFAYDQMYDYYCAKAIINSHRCKQDVRQHLTNSVLCIQNNKLNGYGNVDLFVNACALYAEKFGEECLDIIDQITDELDKELILSKYVRSYQWWNTNSISSESFESILKAYRFRSDDVWEMLIGNSVKTSNPLNADFLHKLLLGYKLNRRDYFWTIYINRFGANNSDRIVQLIKLYTCGKKLAFKDDNQVVLLLTLFCWLLTSSNRWLRDNASKAMIEILKEHFSLCHLLLRKFENVNDPYVIQRLYGVVFGACCKKNDTESDIFKKLAEYVYSTIFDKETVYPDILLRDYARLVIERFLYENPNYAGIVNTTKIIPPYKSEPIPEIEDQHYTDYKEQGPLQEIISSMRFEGMGWYGDFGRYVFQAALQCFEVDDKRIFNYSIYFILNELKFSEDLFRNHDYYSRCYDRHSTAKLERIGKKYQWIAMYNILSRVADHCKMKDEFDDECYPFEGAWEPYVRDFDPTLNQQSMVYPNAPHFSFLDDFVNAAIAENDNADISTKHQQDNWLNTQGVFHQNLKNALLLKDEQGTEWVALKTYIGTGSKDLDIRRLCVWSWMYAYFISPEQKKEIEMLAQKKLDILSRPLLYHHNTYCIFNREYPWAPSCRVFNQSAWIDASVKTGETDTVYETIPDMDSLATIDSDLLKLFSEQDNELDDNEAGAGNQESDLLAGEIKSPDIKYKEVVRKVDREKVIGKFLCASSELIWEEQYDASKEGTISWNVPSAMFIEKLQLKQLNADGFYFDRSVKLAAFDVNLTQKHDCVVVRKDLLDRFLAENKMELIWIVQSEKEIHSSDRSIAQWSEWEALFTYERDRIDGSIYQKPNHIE